MSRLTLREYVCVLLRNDQRNTPENAASFREIADHFVQTGWSETTVRQTLQTMFAGGRDHFETQFGTIAKVQGSNNGRVGRPPMLYYFAG